MARETYIFKLKPLPYGFDSLEPFIDAWTMELHHDKHLATYVDNLNNTIEKYPNYYDWSLEKLLYNINSLPEEIRTAVRNNGGGVYNHNLFFSIMTPGGAPIEDSHLLHAINKAFGTFEDFKSGFKQAALEVFGSGYAWLVSDSMGNLSILKTPNQDTQIPLNLTAVLIIDVWEHAYYLKNQNRRNEYIDNWFNVINYKQAELNYLTYKTTDFSQA